MVRSKDCSDSVASGWENAIFAKVIQVSLMIWLLGSGAVGVAGASFVKSSNQYLTMTSNFGVGGKGR